MNVWGDECLILGRGWWMSEVMNVWGDECLRWWTSGWWMSDNRSEVMGCTHFHAEQHIVCALCTLQVLQAEFSTVVVNTWHSLSHEMVLGENKGKWDNIKHLWVGKTMATCTSNCGCNLPKIVSTWWFEEIDAKSLDPPDVTQLSVCKCKVLSSYKLQGVSKKR